MISLSPSGQTTKKYTKVEEEGNPNFKNELNPIKALGRSSNFRGRTTEISFSIVLIACWFGFDEIDLENLDGFMEWKIITPEDQISIVESNKSEILILRVMGGLSLSCEVGGKERQEDGNEIG